MSFQQIPSPELGGIPVLFPQVEIWVADHSVHHKEVWHDSTKWDMTSWCSKEGTDVVEGAFRRWKEDIWQGKGKLLQGVGVLGSVQGPNPCLRRRPRLTESHIPSWCNGAVRGDRCNHLLPQHFQRRSPHYPSLLRLRKPLRAPVEGCLQGPFRCADCPADRLAHLTEQSLFSPGTNWPKVTPEFWI